MSRIPGSTRVNGAALEQIMRDVLLGIREFTEEACAGCSVAGMEIEAVEAGSSGESSTRENVIPFARQRKSA